MTCLSLQIIKKTLSFFKKNLSLFIHILKIFILITLIAYLLVSGKLDLHKLSFLIKKENITTLIIVISLLLVSYLTLALRQKIFINSLGGRLRTSLSIQIIFVALLLNIFFIGAIGIELVRMYYLKAHTKILYSELSGFILIDRLLGIISLVLIAYLNLVVFFLLGGREYFLFLNTGFIKFIFYISLVPILFLTFVLFLRSEKMNTLSSKLIPRFIFRQQIQNFIDSLKKLTCERKTLFAIVGLCIIGNLSAISGISFLAFHLYGRESMAASFFFTPFVFLLSAIPVTPGNIGWTETVADTVWSMVGIQGGATVFAVWRLIGLSLSLLGGLFYVRMGKDFVKPVENDRS